MAELNFILSIMRCALVTLAVGLIAAVVSAGCFFGDEPTAAPAPSDAKLQATIDAALARIATQETGSTTGTFPPPATPTPEPGLAQSPPAIPAVPPTPVTSTETQATPVIAHPAEFRLSEVRNWDFAVQSHPAVVVQIQSIRWVTDGLQTPDEFNAAERMVNLGIDAPETLSALLASNELRDQLRPMDLPALLSLQRMARDRPDRLAQVAGASWFRDGLTTTEGAIVSILYERSRFRSPEFDAIVSDPGTLTVELGAATNRNGSLLPIAIIRSGPAPPGSPTMGVAQIAVPIFEDMFDAVFPSPAMVIHVTQYVAGVAAGTNYQTHITLLPEIDSNAKPDFAPHAVFHEIAHYYLYAKPIWYAEGGADFAASYALRMTTGKPLQTTNLPCSGAETLSELQLILPSGPQPTDGDENLLRCNYYLGERLLMALYRQLGEERFLAGWRALYAELNRDPSYPSQREFTETDIRVAWLRAGGMQMQPDLEHIWDQWYRGRASRIAAEPPDPWPVDSSLPGINGRIDEAYVALTPDGPPVDSFSASDVNGWAYLTLKYTYSLPGGPQDLTLELAEYFEDGFSNGRRTVRVPVQPQHIGGVQWLSVGPTAPLRWAPGRYWVYVYETGRKVAEVQFEVTP